MLSILDGSDEILVVSALDLPTIKNVKLCLEIMDSLNYGDDKIKLVLNRSNADSGMDVREVEETLHYKFAATVPNDYRTVLAAVNRGIPFVVTNPETPVSQSLFHLARTVADDCEPGGKPQAKGMVGKLRNMFG